MDDQATLLPINRAARILHVPAKWLRREAQDGRIPALQADDRFLVDLDAVERVLLLRARDSLADPATQIARIPTGST